MSGRIRGAERGGLVVVPHFPAPFCEVVADVALGRVDGIEVADFTPSMETSSIREWYRLLGAGFRVAIVGGTDKMSAAIPLGGVRTYARLATPELSFEAWAEAVRAGRTFATSGPLLDLAVDGRTIGDVVTLPGNGGTVEVEAEAVSHWPITGLEVVHNGRVVAREEGGAESRRLRLATRLQAAADGWIAARCFGPSPAYQPPWLRWPIASAAHTSPVYLAGTGVAAGAGDLTYLATIVEGGLAWLDTLATPVDASTQARLRRSFLDARRVLDAAGRG